MSRGPTLSRILPKDANVICNVVFVHGLGDDAHDAWRAPGGFFWPEELAHRLPEAQFWTLGYDAPKFWFSGPGMALPDRAANLLQFLIDKGFGVRPLIFVCHSLGGLVVKSVLRQSKTGGVRTLEPLADCTRGIVFIATPHRGAFLATAATALGVASATTKDLLNESAWLRETATWYRNNAADEGYATRAFAEMLPLAGRTVLVVAPSSADPDVAGTVCQPIDANHIDICKPRSPDDPVYVGVKAFLEQCFQSMGATAASREALFRRYREFLLASCDIIDLALTEPDFFHGYPAIELRRLFVPLRVRPAVVGGAAGDDGANVGDRLCRVARIVILGDPGSGKTTLTRWIATCYLLRLQSELAWRNLPDVETLPDRDWLPIVVRCRDLDSNCVRGALHDLLSHAVRRAQMGAEQTAQVEQLLAAKVEAGQALLILDGLDEIANVSDRLQFCLLIETIATAHRDLAIIVTCRLAGYQEMGRRLGRDFEHLVLLELRPEDTAEFARRWCRLMEEPERQSAAVAEFIADVRSTRGIERLMGNPLLLTTMALARKTLGTLPQRRTDLYWAAIDVLLNSRMGKSPDRIQAAGYLQYLAYAMCDRGAQLLREDEVLEVFAQMRAEFPSTAAATEPLCEDVLRLGVHVGILHRAGFVRHLGRPVATYEFRHLTFQEYLAARSLVERRFPGAASNGKLAEHVGSLAGRTAPTGADDYLERDATGTEGWGAVLRLVTGICDDRDVDEMLRSILQPRKGEAAATVRARAVQGAFCLADEPNVSEAVALDTIRALVSQAEARDSTGIPDLSAFHKAASDLALTRWRSALCAALLEEFYRPSEKVRQRYGALLGMIDCEALPRSTHDISDWFTQCLLALRHGAEPAAGRAALAVMTAAYQGRAVATPGLIAALLDRIRTDSAQTTFAAAWALFWLNNERLGDRQWQPSVAELEAIAALTEERSAHPETLFWLVRVIAQAKGPRSILERLRAAPDERLRGAVEVALAELANENAEAALLPLLDSENGHVRSAALESIARTLDDVDRKLLSRDVDGEHPFRDPRDPIPRAWMHIAASRLNLTQPAVYDRYERLGRRFGLRLEA